MSNLNWRNKLPLDIGGIPTALGEIVNTKFYLDLVKDRYSQINIGFYKPLWNVICNTNAPDWKEKEKSWSNLLDELGKLFFSMPPYNFLPVPTKYCGHIDHVIAKINLTPQKAEMAHLLCKGTSLNIGEYIVITTKARELNRQQFLNLAPELWDTLKLLSTRYKIVILGERKLAMRKEYRDLHDLFFCIYDQIIISLPTDCVLDLTVPALGETCNTLKDLQQDCFIMKEAKAVITVGIGGNFTISTAISDLAIGFRTDQNVYTDIVFNNREYPNAIITKDWNRFIRALKELY